MTVELPDGTRGDTGICRGCHAEIVWVITKNGKRAPMNPDGVSHFATCPARDRFRSRVVADGTRPGPTRGSGVTADGTRGMTRG